MAVRRASAESITSLNELKPGNHIKVNQGLYDHHMIVVNVVSYNTITVIHKRKQQLAVVEEDIYCYTPDKIIRMVYYSPYNQQEIIERARQRIGEYYNLLFANCEHFATEVRTGTPVSLQVETRKQQPAVEEIVYYTPDKIILLEYGSPTANKRSLREQDN
ncbi:hypothetical protein GBAR_LOCUS6967 [Geodia barretti]|uniref:LRAT domain-containing protein n=1 Tax=Geodia barretti TaxID=519541 RepID=A0AA35RH33_GEOBA|nr:hypothetical protein GBAR_LOCUS6967 [Geodia barretti]